MKCHGRINIALVYSVFALTATAVNIGTQDLLSQIYFGAYPHMVSVGAGTFTGLIIKYVLDKRYIFCFQPSDSAHDVKKFILYSLMGAVTTIIFWGFEFGFYYLFSTKKIRYAGGILGLAIGYVSKYHLDKVFVFNKENCV